MVSLIVDDPTLKLNPLKCAAQLLGRLVWIVTGREVGKGSDGEPLLVEVRILPYGIRYESIPAEIKLAGTLGSKLEHHFQPKNGVKMRQISESVDGS